MYEFWEMLAARTSSCVMLLFFLFFCFVFKLFPQELKMYRQGSCKQLAFHKQWVNTQELNTHSWIKLKCIS